MTGETQLRAKRTRIKILKAIAERQGSAGFSDIKVNTGLSTGSIYYHLQRMNSYVTKDAKHYIITEEGLRLLREADSRFMNTPITQVAEESTRDRPIEGRRIDHEGGEEPAAHKGFSKLQRVAILGGLAFLGISGMLYFSPWGNLGLISPGSYTISVLIIVLVAALTASISLRKRRWLFPHAISYRGLMLSILPAAVVISVTVFLSTPLSGATAPHYDNSMDALLSSYSLHWQVR